MARKNTAMKQVLDNGTEVGTCKNGWEESAAENIPVFATGWKGGSAVHFSAGLGVMLAAAQQVEGIQVDTFNGVPVIDGPAFAQDIINTYIEAKNLDVPKIRMAGNRASAAELQSVKSENNDLRAQIEAMKAAALQTDE